MIELEDIGLGQHSVIIVANSEPAFVKEAKRSELCLWQCFMARTEEEINYLNKRSLKRRVFKWADDCYDTPLMRTYSALEILQKWGVDD